MCNKSSSCDECPDLEKCEKEMFEKYSWDEIKQSKAIAEYYEGI
jgi:hypothetical protein